MIYNTFNELDKPKWVAGDTETYTLIDGVKVSEAELVNLGKTHDQAWFRAHCSVQAYAWLISDGIHFAWLESFDEFVEFCCLHKIKSIWWYNAKFDFAIFDYALLTSDWKRTDEDSDGRDKTYSSLHNDMGARYSLKLWKAWKGHGRKQNRHIRVHSFTNYDFCNLFGGGLKRCLESFKVTDYDGNPIRKLEMDYQGENDANNSQAIAYMKNDVLGLYHLVRIASAWLEENTGLSLTGTKPDVITAGGLAKRLLLEELYKSSDKRENVKAFQREHKMDLALDKYLREHFLYRGGITFVNPYKQNREITETFFKYDINSMYPAQMNRMPDLYGRPISKTYEEYKKLKNKNKYVTIIELDYLRGRLKENMLGMWYDPYLKKFTAEPEINEDETPQMMFVNEFLEYKENWFKFEYHIKRVILIRQRKIDGYSNFVQKYYKMKADGKAQKDPVKTAFAKLLLNSSYGKLAERASRLKTHRELTDQGYVHLVPDEVESDESTLMSVIQGALVTSMARTMLLKYIRQICQGNPKKNLIYCDTDSVHSLTKFDETDDYELGKMKEEAICQFGKYLAPKTYIDGIFSDKWNWEIHSKGVPTSIIKNVIGNADPNLASKIFCVGRRFMALGGMNVVGGKALIPTPKTICKPDNCIMYNNDGEQILIDEIDERIIEKGDEENEIIF